MVSQRNLVISGAEVPNVKTLFYYPNVNTLSYNPDDEELLQASENFGETLFLFFKGIRKIRALKEASNDSTMLYIEPWRTCNLKCSYCYAHAGAEYKQKVPFSLVESLINKYKFKKTMVYGGDPLIDKKFISSVIDTTDWNMFFFSTNGILMDSAFREKLIETTSSSVQVSIEPPEWNNRVNSSGKKHYDLVKDKLKLFSGIRFDFRLVIPSNAPYIPLKKFLDYISDAMGSENFTVSYWPAYEEHLPSWADKWIQESLDLMKGPESKKYKNKLLGGSLSDHVVRNGRFFRYFYCNAAYGSVSVGPDGKLHACHHNAILENDYDIISGSSDNLSINKEKVLNLTYEWTSNMNKDVCATCEARYICGGGCFLSSAPRSECEFRRLYLPLALADLSTYRADIVPELISRSRNVFNKLYSMNDEISKEVRSKEWADLLTGKLAIGRAIEMANQFEADW